MPIVQIRCLFTMHRPINRQNRWLLIITKTADAGGSDARWKRILSSETRWRHFVSRNIVLLIRSGCSVSFHVRSVFPHERFDIWIFLANTNNHFDGERRPMAIVKNKQINRFCRCFADDRLSSKDILIIFQFSLGQVQNCFHFSKKNISLYRNAWKLKANGLDRKWSYNPIINFIEPKLSPPLRFPFCPWISLVFRVFRIFFVGTNIRKLKEFTGKMTSPPQRLFGVILLA